MGFIDWLILAILLIFLVQGFRKGLAAALIRIGGTIAAFFLVGQFYPLVRNSLILNFKLHGILATLVAVILIGVLLMVVIRLLIYVMNRLLKAVNLSFFNKLLGALFGFGNGLLCVIVLMVVLDYVPKVSTPLKDSGKHRVYAAVDTLKDDLFTQLKLTEKDKYLKILDSLKKDKDKEHQQNEQ
ncbi:MAG TPA: CvpA family protein [Candidatus Syntrophosphaera sp.]|jgi:membrane protein required for colicin V production|nr:CvpA family protein [Candidatus Syntrophosphaera sp.]